jgi:hypothetical protein
VPGHSTPFLTLLQIRLVACQLGRAASDNPVSPEHQAAYNSAIDLSSREVSDRFLAQQIQRSLGDFQGRSTSQPPPLERMEAPLGGHATSTSAPNPESPPSLQKIWVSWSPPSTPGTRAMPPGGSTAGLSCTKDLSNARS